MTAIAGLWSFDQKPGLADICEKMLVAQRIYGPHASHQLSLGSIAIGRTLFRTLPEDVYDSQPLQTSDGRLSLVADVRLDNREELIAELGWRASEANRACDASILLGALERWGKDSLDHLVGDFAFALWNERVRELWLARDFVGARPLHYHRGHGFFAFASMPKGLHALPEVPYGPDEEVAAGFLVHLSVSGSKTFFKGIERVAPAHIVTVSEDRISARQHWQPRQSSRARVRTDETIEGVRYHLDQATRAQLRGATKSVGTTLTAGLDSAAVTATAARLLSESSTKIIAFTATPRHGYKGRVPYGAIADESPLAAETAALYSNIENVVVQSREASLLAGLDRSFLLYETIVPNPANMGWITAINEAARQRNLGIMLIGRGGNAAFSYSGYEILSELFGRGHLVRYARIARAIVRQSAFNWRGILGTTVAPFMPVWLWERAISASDERESLVETTALRPELLGRVLPNARDRQRSSPYRPWADGFAMRRWMVTRIDHGNLSKGTLGGWGLDQRAPLQDRRLIEFCLSVPTEEFIAEGVPRALARKVLADRLPAAVVQNRRAGYQAADWHEHLTAARTDVEAEIARLAEHQPTRAILDIPRLRFLTANWPTSAWHTRKVVAMYRQALQRAISVGHFLRKTSGANQ